MTRLLLMQMKSQIVSSLSFSPDFLVRGMHARVCAAARLEPLITRVVIFVSRTFHSKH